MINNVKKICFLKILSFLLMIGSFFITDAMGSTCTIASDIPVSFGDYSPNSATPLDATGRLKVTCSGGSVSYQIALNAGSGSNGSFSPRKMLNGIRDRKSTRLNSSHIQKSRMPSSA